MTRARGQEPTERTTPSPDPRTVLRGRWHAQELDRGGPLGGPGRPVDDVAVLDLGVQDTDADGAAWALENRGARVPRGSEGEHGLALVWTLRGATHVYRRADLPGVARATAPFSEADARSRIYAAAGPLGAAGIPALDALRTVAHLLREIVTEPMPKGEVSTRLTSKVDDPYLRWCEGCGATHLYELPFRLAALHAGLELVPGTSPPVLRPIPGWAADPFPEPPTDPDPEDRLDVVVGFRRLYSGASPRHLAAFLDAPLPEVRARWSRAETAARGSAGAVDHGADRTLRLLGPFDPFLQLRDRELLVPEAALRAEVWRTLGRPGAVLLDGELRGLWRPRTTGRTFSVRLSASLPRAAALRPQIEEQAVALAGHRGRSFGGLLDE